jgi:superfamily I DNA and/or RNA helicase
LSAPVAWIDLAGEQEALGGSLWNRLELQETLRLVQRLLAAGITPAEIAIITPYRGQLERLRRSFAELRIPLEFSLELAEGDALFGERASAGLALGTVHRFQGGERSIVLFSSVITRASSLPFLNARPNLLNVAVSRAQHHFVGLGRREVLARGALTRLLTDAARVIAGGGVLGDKNSRDANVLC